VLDRRQAPCCVDSACHSSSVYRRERVKKRGPSGPSSKNMPLFAIEPLRVEDALTARNLL